MKTMFYSRLALDAIRKNSKLYIPYALTCILMTAIFYILSFLSLSPLLNCLPGGGLLIIILKLGSFVIAVFSIIFLFYTNSFLIRRRRKEFGLYNILGMTKRNISRILIHETVFMLLAALAGGLFSGILLSKLSELCLIRMIGHSVDFSFSVSAKAIKHTILLFSAVFLLLFLNSVRQVRFASAIELMRSENVGEKPPKANPVLGAVGVVILGAAYYIAVCIEHPVEALVWFFIAVIMVIIATYIIFISGSVLLCRLLQKNKSYYYKKNHFVSVSSMAYRMKRNGAGLASICILLTMVFVMISSSGSLFFGKEDSLRARYPRDMIVTLYNLSESDVTEPGKYLDIITDCCSSYDTAADELIDYHECAVSGMYDEAGNVDIFASENAYVDYTQLVTVHMIPLNDYRRMTGKDISLSAGEALVSAEKLRSIPASFTVCGMEFRAAGVVSDFIHSGDATADIFPNIYLIIDNFSEASSILAAQTDYKGHSMTSVNRFIGFDSDADPDTQFALLSDISKALYFALAGTDINYGCESYAANRDDFFIAYGGLFFLGIMLTIVFLIAAALIIYYKQLSEGYEDCGRFTILQNIGMTKRDIRANINSQMLTVFFLPLVFAVLHLGFAFPMINKLLLLLGLNNLPLFIKSSAVCVLIFAVFYAVVYSLTSNEYYRIVSAGER